MTPNRCDCNFAIWASKVLGGAHSEAPGRSSGAGHQQHPKPENQDSEHMLNQHREPCSREGLVMAARGHRAKTSVVDIVSLVYYKTFCIYKPAIVLLRKGKRRSGQAPSPWLLLLLLLLPRRGPWPSPCRCAGRMCWAPISSLDEGQKGDTGKGTGKQTSPPTCPSGADLAHILAMGKYGCRKAWVYPVECSQHNLGEIPPKMGAPKPLLKKLP